MYSGSDISGCPNQVLGLNTDKESQEVKESKEQEQERDRKKWVINISSKPLSQDQEKLLAHGPNFAVVPKDPPITQYVAGVENACTKLEEGKVEEFRVQVKLAIQKIKHPRPNLTRGERRAISDHREMNQE